MRNLSSAMETALQEPVIRPVLIGYLDIESDPIAMWTGPGTFAPTGTPDAILNGKLFSPFEAFGDVSDIQESDGIGGPVSITLKAPALAASALRQIIRDKRRWQLRAAYLWLGLLDETKAAVYEYPVRIKTAVMTQAALTRSPSDVSIVLTLDEDQGGAISAPFNLLDHREYFADDTFTAYLVELANKPGGLERPSAARSANAANFNQFPDAWERDNTWTEY